MGDRAELADIRRRVAVLERTLLDADGGLSELLVDLLADLLAMTRNETRAAIDAAVAGLVRYGGVWDAERGYPSGTR